MNNSLKKLPRMPREQKFFFLSNQGNEHLILVRVSHENSFLEAEGMEETWKFSQDEIVQHVDVSSARKVSIDHLPTN